MALTWYDRRFEELELGELHAILALRAQVFVVEQRCAYADVDGLDPPARHVFARDGEGDAIAAYLRILPAGVRYDELAIGRVVVAPAHRGQGLGRELMERGLAAAGPVAVRISAQAHLERFYRDLGFARTSDVYDEDGIPHVEMLRPA